jgi:hypothetical protein
MIRDSVLVELVRQQTEAFQNDSSIELKESILKKIQKRQAELAKSE